MARPIKKVDEEAIKKLAQMHCTYDEIAEFCEVSTKTLQRKIGRARVGKECRSRWSPYH